MATTQVVAFGAASAVGRPTWYLPVALTTAALLGWRGHGAFGLAVAALGAVALLALAVPLAAFLVRQDPALVAAAATDPAVLRTLALTAYGPALAAGFAVAFGVPLALALARGFPGDTLVAGLVDLPLVVPHSVAGIVVLFGFGRGGVFPSVAIGSTLAGVVLAFTFVSAPYAVNAARAAFENVDPDLRRAARSQGAGPFATFRRVELPLARRGIVTGGVLAWARGVSEFGAVAVVAYTVETVVPGLGPVAAQHAPVYVFAVYSTEGLPAAGAVAVVLLAASGAVFLLVRLVTSETRPGVV
ncbi:MAG: ABC transporter permease [Halobaculum sp.]